MNPYNVACRYVFKMDHLALDNQLVCSLLGKATSPALSFPQLLVVLCVEYKLHGPFLVYFGLSIGVNLVQLTLGGHVGETLWMWLLTLLDDTVSRQTP